MNTATELHQNTTWSQERRAQLIEEMKAPRVRYDRLARQFGLSEIQLRDFHVNTIGRWVASIDGWGRPELRKYAVARRHADGEWDSHSPRIIEAKKAYDRGLCEVMTGRDGFWLILYAVPLKKQATDRRPYFGFAR